VPNPGNPLDWDRFSYVRNNPLRYVDPSGHFCEMVGSNEICSADDDSNGHWLPSWTLSELVDDLWGWSIEGEWEDGAINTIVNAGFAIQSYIYKIGGNGQDWLRNYLGKAVFKRDAISKAWFFLVGPSGVIGDYSGGVVMANYVIRLPSGFGIDTVFHELAHVLDNHSKSGLLPATWTGGGAADAFISAMGGNPNACFVRWNCSGTHFDNAGIDITRWERGTYGNNGVADDFAVTFEYLLASKPGIPESRKIWMQSFLALTAKPIP
jgi:hypothetical protein